MILFKLLLIINYIFAAFILMNITNDDIWNKFLTILLEDKELEEQQQLMLHSVMIRRILCWILIIPGIGLILLLILINLLNKIK